MTETGENELRVKVAGYAGRFQFEQHADGYVLIIEGTKTRLRYFPNGTASDTKDRLDMSGVPDYPNDLNACAEFEKMLVQKGTKDVVVTYVSHLFFILREDGVPITNDRPNAYDCWAVCTATATQRCQAFVKTMEEKR